MAAIVDFALGFYELFIGELEAIPRPLRVRSFDQFKGWIASQGFLMLVIWLFQRALLRLRYGRL